MEKDLSLKQTTHPKSIDINGNLSSFAYDSLKKTLYWSDDSPQALENLKEINHFENIVEISIKSATNHSEEEKIYELPKKSIEMKSISFSEKNKISPQYINVDTLRFCRTLSSDQISPSGLTATCGSNDTDSFWNYYSNITFKRGIHYWEIICPIACSGIEFGIKNRETNEIIWATFRTTTPRVVGMQLDLTSQTLKFWLNGRPQVKRNQSFSKGEYYLLIKMKNCGNTVILNPFAQLNEENSHLPNSILLTKEEKYCILSAYESISKQKSKPRKEKELPKIQTTQGEHKSDSDNVPEEGETQKIKPSETSQSKSQLNEVTKSSDEEVDVESEFAQNYEKLLFIYESVRDDKTSLAEINADHLKWSTVDYTDKVLSIGKSWLKVIARNQEGNLDLLLSLIQTLKNSEKNHLILSKQDMMWLLKQTNWKRVNKFLTSTDERSWMSTFIEAWKNLQRYKLSENITLVLEIEFIPAKIVIDAILKWATEAYEEMQSIYQKMKNESILQGSSVIIQKQKINQDESNSYFYEDSWSLIKILQLISVLLSLQEQLWISSMSVQSQIDSSLLEKCTSRTQSAYGRLSSFTSWPSSQVHPIKLSEAGLVNTSDQHIRLNHYLEYGTQIEEEALKSTQNEGNSLSDFLQSKFPNNLMVKGYPSINVPLHKTINLFPPWKHTSDVDQEKNCFVEKEITDLWVPKYSEFLISANSEDGSAWIWNSQLHLFLAGRINFK
jgi:hypothetical protein